MQFEDKIVYQIIDANLNRIREGMRCVEEAIRYSPVAADSYEQFRQLRHRFSKIEGELREQLPLLLQSRNMFTDGGTAGSAKTQRSSMRLLIIANTNRVSEGLRVVEEYLKLIDDTAKFTEKIKQIRYDWYAIEQLLASSN